MRRLVIDGLYYLAVTCFLVAQTMRNFYVDTDMATGRGAALGISVMAVGLALTGWILCFSGVASAGRGPFRRGPMVVLVWTVWHLGVIALLWVRASAAFQVNLSGTGTAVVQSYLWILAAAGVCVPTVAHFLRPPVGAPMPTPVAPPPVLSAERPDPSLPRPRAQPDALPAPGEKIGKYDIRGLLGRGAMGTVYDAFDPQIARRVAIKVIRLPDMTLAPADAEAAELLERFRREARASGRLHHPSIAEIFDYGETDAIAYIVMEFIDGVTLAAMLDSRRLAVPEAARLMRQLLDGLQYSHDRGVVHRDIKPANIMLARDGTLKITDFGIARLDYGEMTRTGGMLGTAAYMSPEQFLGQPVDGRSDIYSAAIVLFRMLTGERPFEGGIATIMNRVLNDPPPLPSARDAAVPPMFDAVLRRAMAREPADRYPSAAAFAAAIQDAAASLRANETRVVRAADRVD